MNHNVPIPIQIKEKLRKVAPEAKAILFGSRARGDAKKESDWDVLILLDKPKIEASDFDLISYPLFELGWDNQENINPVMYTIKEWEKYSFTPFFHNVKQEGIIL